MLNKPPKTIAFEGFYAFKLMYGRRKLPRGKNVSSKNFLLFDKHVTIKP